MYNLNIYIHFLRNVKSYFLLKIQYLPSPLPWLMLIF
jgi:hypothetical protein